MGKRFFRFLYWLWGWKIEGKAPDLKKYLLIVAPHTSSWDFPVGYIAKELLEFKPHFLAKKSLFKIPLVGWFLKISRGHPVDRNRNMNLVDQVVMYFNTLDEFIMTITPEGTRAYAPQWKTGFYRIAEKANVPMVLVGFDYSTKTVILSEPIYTQGNMDEEIETIKDFFRPIKGKHPDQGVR